MATGYCAECGNYGRAHGRVQDVAGGPLRECRYAGVDNRPAARPIIQDNTGGEPAGPDMCGAVYERHDGTLDTDYPCVLVPGHVGEHEDDEGQMW